MVLSPLLTLIALCHSVYELWKLAGRSKKLEIESNQRFKVVVMGDEPKQSSKYNTRSATTAFLCALTYAQRWGGGGLNELDYIPVFFENYVADELVDGKTNVEIALWDTVGQNDVEEKRRREELWGGR